MATTRIGATRQYAENWEDIFGGRRGKSSAKMKPAKSATRSTKKKASKKKSAKPAKSTKRKAAGAKKKIAKKRSRR